jgi:hypothetical protein
MFDQTDVDDLRSSSEELFRKTGNDSRALSRSTAKDIASLAYGSEIALRMLDQEAA